MRILFLTPAFPPFSGGGERYVGALARELARRGHEVTVVTSAAQMEQELWLGTAVQQTIFQDVDGVKVVRCPIRPFFGKRNGLLAWRKGMALLSLASNSSATMLFQMARFIPPVFELEETLSSLPGSFDLVHGFNISWEYPLTMGWRYARAKGIPFVITPFAHFGSGSQDRVALNSTMVHQRHVMNDADAALVLTSIEAEGLRQYNITPRYVDVIGGGLDDLPPRLEPEKIAAKYQLHDPFALFIGRVNRDKGALDAAKAILTLRQKGQPVTLALIGQVTPEFNRFYANLNGDEKEGIRPLGVLSDSEKHALLEACTLFLMPSHSDSFGIVFLEAWAHSKPVIGARAGGIPGVVDDGVNGILVPYGDVPVLAQAVRRLLTERELNQIMGQRGHEKVAKKYSWDHVVGRTVVNYQKCLSRSNEDMA
ncbi:MAG: glycosyltransferase family 4 protein [Anaerolineae bacterium]|nr:glycosyltransferase family 4 protein [Anaerolineae bacterium]